MLAGPDAGRLPAHAQPHPPPDAHVQPGAEVVTLSARRHRSSGRATPSWPSAWTGWRACCRRSAIEHGRPRGDASPGTTSATSSCTRGPVHGRGAAHAEHPPVRRAAHLHRQPRRGPGDLRRRLARAAAGEAGAELRGRAPLRGDGRRRRGLAAATRCATRSCSRRPAPATSTTPSSTSARRRRSATRAARPATPRACSTRTARSACTPRLR